MNSATPDHLELLAPAGDVDCLRAAIANGAHAVYFGLPQFSARARATNISLGDLPGVFHTLHDHNVRGYVAFNTLIFPEELPQAVEYVQSLAAAGADAVIVQDLGLASLICAAVPDLPIHASTQMTITDARGAAVAAGLGIRRVILARELSVDQIAAIAHASDVEVEVFVHGALCISYSGQCLASQWLFARSGNRGQCAQACRLSYRLVVDGELFDQAPPYPLSPHDLGGWGQIGRLAEAGVTSLKIEGRLKGPHYVAAACRVGRAALDAAQRGESWRPDEPAMRELEQGFTRGFEEGFLQGPQPGRLVGGQYPNSRGVRIGTVEMVGNRIRVALAEGVSPDRLAPGDGVLFDAGDEARNQGGRLYEVRTLPTGRVELAFGNDAVNLDWIRPGQGVWKTDDPAVRKRLEQTWSRDVVPNPAVIDATVTAEPGRPIRLDLRDAAARLASAEADAPAEVARKHPPTVEMLRDQLSRLGDTPFVLGEVSLVPPDSQAMIPKSVLNDLRRRAAADLAGQRHEQTIRPLADPAVLDHLRLACPPAPPVGDTQTVSVLVRRGEQLASVLDVAVAHPGRLETVYADLSDVEERDAAMERIRSAGLAAGLVSPRICQQLADEDALAAIAAAGPDRVLVRNLSAAAYLAERSIPCVGDASLNVANDLTAAVLARLGLTRLTPSLDLTISQVVELARQAGGGWFEPVVHLHVPLMVTAHCLFSAHLGGGCTAPACGQPCRRHRLALRDRKDMDHVVEADAGCRNVIYAGRTRSDLAALPALQAAGIGRVRVELLHESPDRIADIFDRVMQATS